MVEITVRDALPADVPFLRDALAKLNDEMQKFSDAAGFRAEGFPGLNIEGYLQRDSFLIAVAGEEPRGFLSIYLPLVRARQMAMINTAYVVPMYHRQGHCLPASYVRQGQMPGMGCDRHPPWLHRGERCGGGRLQ